MLVTKMQFKFNLFYMIQTKILVHCLNIKKIKDLPIYFIFHLLQIYIKDPPNGAKVGSKNIEKLIFGLSLKNNTCCTVKVYKNNRYNKEVLQCFNTSLKSSINWLMNAEKWGEPMYIINKKAVVV